MQTHKQMHLRSFNLTLIRQSSKEDEWEGMCSAQEDVRESKYPRESSRSQPTSIYRSPQKNRAAGSRNSHTRGDRTRHSVRLLHRDLPDKRHVSRFESRSFDRNDHLNVLVYALEWLDAPIKINRTRLGIQSPLIHVADHATGRAAWTNQTLQCQRPVDSSKLPLMTWCVPERATASDRSFAFAVPLAPDWTRRSSEWPNAPVINPSPRARLLLSLTGRVRSCRDHVRFSVRSPQWPSFASVSIHVDLEKNFASDVVDNRRFTSTKSVESRL
jgi:hypothetical protein